MENDAELNQRAALLPIRQVAEQLGLTPEEIEPHGRYMAKVTMAAVRRAASSGRRAKLIYTTAITATPAGEGKTTVAIGLAQAMGRMAKKVAVCLREPSLGPTFGVKGGATGGGRSQVAPMVDINLHFTGDLHAVTSAHNLLAAAVDNHIHQGNELGIDPKRVTWRRVMDMNERQLRRVIVGLGAPADGVVRETGFDITAASEVMAVLCLSRDLDDLKERLGRMVVGQTAGAASKRRWVTAREIGVVGAMAVLLKDALKPNLVQTLEGQPALIHGGPFANIAHGNNSILATQTALGLADYAITEGGFAADLGAEKFFDIVVPQTGLVPDVVVLVASVRALHHHGGAARSALHEADPETLRRGFSNLDRHITNLQKYGLPVVVAVNRFSTDDPGELREVADHCRAMGVEAAVADVVARGGEGGIDLAQAVLRTIETSRPDFRPIYRWEEPLVAKIERLATEIYGADGVDFVPEARAALDELTAKGFGQLPVCVAKTQFSITDDPQLRGAPSGWRLKVREIRPSLGAGFIVVLTGEVMTMPGLPKEPAALRMDIDEAGYVTGLS